SVKINQESGYSVESAQALLLLALIDIISGQFDAAERKADEARNLDLDRFHLEHRFFRGFIQLGRGRWNEARTALIEYLKQPIADLPSLMRASVLGIGLVMTEEGQTERGLALAALTLNDEHLPTAFANSPLVSRHLEAIKGKLGEEAYAAAWEL